MDTTKKSKSASIVLNQNFIGTKNATFWIEYEKKSVIVSTRLEPPSTQSWTSGANFAPKGHTYKLAKLISSYEASALKKKFAFL